MLLKEYAGVLNPPSKMYSTQVEQYVDDCLNKQFGIVERLSTMFLAFLNYNIKIMQNLIGLMLTLMNTLMLEK